jgi:hypothetical protein
VLAGGQTDLKRFRRSSGSGGRVPQEALAAVLDPELELVEVELDDEPEDDEPDEDEEFPEPCDEPDEEESPELFEESAEVDSDFSEDEPPGTSAPARLSVR